MFDDIINNKKQTKQTKSKRKTQNKTKQNKTKHQKRKYQTVGTPKSNIRIAEIKCEKMPRPTYNRILFLNLIHT